jgi:hypothetical protein
MKLDTNNTRLQQTYRVYYLTTEVERLCTFCEAVPNRD